MGTLKLALMISETVFHFFHIKVTVGDIRVGGGWGFCALLPSENTGLFGFLHLHHMDGIPLCRIGEASQTSIE